MTRVPDSPPKPRLADPQDLIDVVAATGLLPAPGAARVVVLCSGGRDSRCLLDVAAQLTGPASLTVVHVDHGLRPESATEGELVREAAAELGVRDVRLLRAGTAPDGGNLQAWAREQRRQLAAEVAGKLRGAGDNVLVATAHTRSDLVETVLARFATQPGRRALLGFGARGELPGPLPAPLVRPLFTLTRADTTAYCEARGLRFADDPSNEDRRFARARVRHDVLPVLHTLNPHAEAAIARTVTELREEHDALNAIVDAELGGGDGATPEVARARLAALPPALARLVLRALCERSVGRPVAQVTSRLDDVLALRDGGELDVGAGARVRVRGGIVTCVGSRGPAAPQAHP